MLTEYSAIFTHSVENKRKCLTVCRALLVLLLLLLSLLSVDMYMIHQQHHSHGWNVQRSFEMCVSVSLLSWLAIFCLFVFVNVKINEINEHNTFHGVCVFFAGFLFLVDLEYVCIELRLRNKYKNINELTVWVAFQSYVFMKPLLKLSWIVWINNSNTPISIDIKQKKMRSSFDTLCFKSIFFKSKFQQRNWCVLLLWTYLKCFNGNVK